MERLTFDATGSLDGDTLSGVVHVFGTRTMRDGMFHEFAPTAFGKAQPMAFYSHDMSKPLAVPTIGIEGNALHYSMTLGHQSYAMDLRENVAAGLMNRMSFGVLPEKWKDARGADGVVVRTHTKASLFDISPVAMPAFTGTSAQLHSASLTDARTQAIRIRHRVLMETAS